MLYTVYSMITAHRTQIYLDDFRYNELKKKAQKEGKSLAQIVREAIDSVVKNREVKDLKRKEKDRNEFLKLSGIGASGLSDVSQNHDKYLAADEIKSWKRK